MHLKRKVFQLHLELEFYIGKLEEDIKALENALIKAWEALLDSLFKSLVKSVQKRVIAYYRAKG